MKPKQKKQLTVAGAGLVLLLLAMQRKGRGTVHIGPVTVTDEKVDLKALSQGRVTDADVQRLTLALLRSRQLMGADPNTLASRQPSSEEQSYIEQTLASNRVLSQMTGGLVPYPSVEEKRLALAKKLPGNGLQQANAQLYALLGVDPLGDNEATRALTPAMDTAARALIAKWRPYSQDAVDTLFVLLDGSRELAGGAA